MKRQAQEAKYLNEQWLYFKRHFVGYIILLQKGSCWLLEAQYSQYLPVQVQQYCVQKQPSSVAPQNTQLEIPLYFLKNSLNCLQRQQLAYILVTEQGVVHKRLKQRSNPWFKLPLPLGEGWGEGVKMDGDLNGYTKNVTHCLFSTKDSK